MHDMNATDHAAIAESIARTDSPAPSHQCARQGDVVMRRLGDATDLDPMQCPHGGWQIAAGRHGEHRLFADGAHVGNGKLNLPNGGLIVHTDSPDARHGSVQLAPGTWNHTSVRELGIDGVVRPVED